MDPKSPHNGQNEGYGGSHNPQRLIREAHSLCSGQGRITGRHNPVAGRQGLLEAAILSDEILINFPTFYKNNKIKDKNKKLILKGYIKGKFLTSIGSLGPEPIKKDIVF